MDRIAVLGTGVIGGSIALRLAAEGFHVTAHDRDDATLEALSGTTGIEVERAVDAAVAAADLVVVAVPVDQIVTMCRELARCEVHGTVTDVGSTKGGVVRGATRELGPRFIGGHPMAGSEKHGFGASDPTLFDDAPWILTPTELTSEEAYGRVTKMIGALGARPVALDPVAHDRLVARLSHLPQLTASAIVGVVTAAGDEDALLGLAAGGFRDVTRIAASHPEVWVPILRENREGVLEALDAFGAALEGVRDMIDAGRWSDLTAFLSDARVARIGMFVRPDLSTEPVILTLLIPDRPGVLAEVTTAAGEIGANIEDVNIFHSVEGGKGRLELVVTGSTPGEALARRLTALGYHVEQGLPT